MSFTRPHLSTTWSLPYCLSNGWLTSRIDYIHPASGNLIGQLTNVIDPLGSVTNWYNNQGLLVAISNAVGRVESVVYDIEDRPASVTDANGITVSHVYDNLGRLRTRTWPDNNAENWGYSTGYTGPTSYTNQLGGLYRTLFEYDLLERKIAETNANNEVVRFAYRPAGDLATLTDGKNQVTTWNYDLYGQVTNKVDAASAEIFRYAYDATGLLTNRWTKAKGTTAYRYDALGQLTNVVYPVSPALTLQYDALGRLTNLVDGIGQSRYGHANNRLASEDGPWAEDTVSYSYQYGGLRSGLTLIQPNASPWTQSYYGYDAAGNLAQRTNNFAAAQPLVQTFSIANALNQLTSVTRSGKLTVCLVFCAFIPS